MNLRSSRKVLLVYSKTFMLKWFFRIIFVRCVLLLLFYNTVVIVTGSY